MYNNSINKKTCCYSCTGSFGVAQVGRCLFLPELQQKRFLYSVCSKARHTTVSLSPSLHVFVSFTIPATKQCEEKFIFLLTHQTFDDSPALRGLKAQQTRRLQQCWCESVKPWMSHRRLCAVTPTNGRRWISTSPGFHISFRDGNSSFGFLPAMLSSRTPAVIQYF